MLSSLGPQRSRWQSFPHRTAQCKYSTSDSSPGSQCSRVHIPAGLHYKRTSFPRNTTKTRRSIPISSCSTSTPLSPSTIKVARFPHLSVLGRNIQQFFHHWTGTQVCTEACQKAAECTLSSSGPQRSRWQSFPHRTAQCKYSTSDSSPGSQCCRVHIPAGLHSKRTTFPRRQHSKDNTRQQIEGAFQSHRVLRVSHCRPQRSRWQDFRTSCAR